MKIIILDKNTHPINGRLLADSCVVRNNSPVFLPDFVEVERWKVEILPAVVIGRLGKYIAEKFAHRYIDHYVLLARVCPKVREDDRNPMLTMFDGAIVMGEKLDTLPHTLSLSLNETPLRGASGESHREVNVDKGALGIEEAISEVSRCCTVKSGDILVPCNPGWDLPLMPEHSVDVNLNGSRVLTLRLK